MLLGLCYVTILLHSCSPFRVLFCSEKIIFYGKCSIFTARQHQCFHFRRLFLETRLGEMTSIVNILPNVHWYSFCADSSSKVCGLQRDAAGWSTFLIRFSPRWVVVLKNLFLYSFSRSGTRPLAHLIHKTWNQSNIYREMKCSKRI